MFRKMGNNPPPPKEGCYTTKIETILETTK
nr:MAG TPA: hypothetical protein [Caudoviricetes sp.]